MQSLSDYCFGSELEVQATHIVKYSSGYLADCIVLTGASVLCFPFIVALSAFLLFLPREQSPGKEGGEWEFLMLSGCHGWLSPHDFRTESRYIKTQEGEVTDVFQT